MSIRPGGLLAGIKRAVVDAHRSVAEQHMEELAQYFEPAPGQAPGIRFPEGQWEARSVVLKVPHEASRNGKVSIEQRAVHVPLITLLPLRSHTIERVELLTTLDFSLAPPLPPEAASGARKAARADLPSDILVKLGPRAPHSAEVKIDPDADNPQCGPEHDPRLFLLAAWIDPGRLHCRAWRILLFAGSWAADSVTPAASVRSPSPCSRAATGSAWCCATWSCRASCWPASM
ncbi:DUF2589 domain-containing protein [Massilia sp. ST3]|uniref:DUF2589 domain-containing protein n=1 Tax=Massilia sp. ST3 TaxID=2824903 RepID=UPI001B826570|nr:DUF2589 domain-containing protein [Massilia sp. ST3]MBQ5948947.1 DUF2589 domain-containing protein [Massilia sp. ST3]